MSVGQGCMALNYFGNIAAVKQVLPAMIEQKQGHIVLIASALAVFGAPFL